MSDAASLDRIYQHGHHASVVAHHAKRTAEVEAAFFLPFLKPGMRLLDIGCGPGSITTGLAQRVAPGETIGIDPSSRVTDTAAALANGFSAGRLTFAVATSTRLRSQTRRSMQSSRIRCCSIFRGRLKLSRRPGCCCGREA